MYVYACMYSTRTCTPIYVYTHVHAAADSFQPSRPSYPYAAPCTSACQWRPRRHMCSCTPCSALSPGTQHCYPAGAANAGTRRFRLQIQKCQADAETHAEEKRHKWQETMDHLGSRLLTQHLQEILLEPTAPMKSPPHHVHPTCSGVAGFFFRLAEVDSKATLA
jgi:hypothetical protein